MIGALAYGGVYGNEMNTSRGNDNTFNYFAGASTKVAYNWRFARNWSLQPNLMVAYNYFGQENWHTDFGQMGMMSGMLHGINIAPGLNLMYERETWSAYLTLQYMYNINQSVGGRAGNVNMPRISMDRGYIQYGIGVNKKFTDRFSGYFQTVIRNVGRNGIGLQMGFQWKLGKGSSKGKITQSRGNVTPQLPKARITINGVEQK
jgi:outer membrane autotransporter protein